MKRNMVFTLILLVFGVQLMFAQNRPPRGVQGPKKPTVDQRLKNLDDALLLTPEQKKNIRKILQDADTRMKKIFEQNKGNRQAMRAAARDQREQTNIQIMNLLTDKQKVKYKKYLKMHPVQRNDLNRPAKRGMRRGRRY